MDARESHRELVGLNVRASDGERLGQVVQCDDDGFLCEQGVFFPRDFVISYEDVASVGIDELFLRRPSDDYYAEASSVLSRDRTSDGYADPDEEPVRRLGTGRLNGREAGEPSPSPGWR
jgi:hypothetical protein